MKSTFNAHRWAANKRRGALQIRLDERWECWKRLVLKRTTKDTKTCRRRNFITNQQIFCNDQSKIWENWEKMRSHVENQQCLRSKTPQLKTRRGTWWDRNTSLLNPSVSEQICLMQNAKSQETFKTTRQENFWICRVWGKLVNRCWEIF